MGVCKLNWQEPPLQIKLSRAIVVREKTALIIYIWEFTEKCDSKAQLELEAYMVSWEGEKSTYWKTNDVLER